MVIQTSRPFCEFTPVVEDFVHQLYPSNWYLDIHSVRTLTRKSTSR